MPFIDTFISDLKIFEPKVFEDNRGCFFESYNENTFKEAGIITHFVQDNRSVSGKGTLRGMHYQLEPFAQAKLVTVLKGNVFDVAVDMRDNSPTFGKWFGIELSEENKKQLFIPRGFAHGFLVLSDKAEFFYKCDNFYSKEDEQGFLFDDDTIKIDWPIDNIDVILSEKDKVLPTFKSAIHNFEYKK